MMNYRIHNKRTGTTLRVEDRQEALDLWDKCVGDWWVEGDSWSLVHIDKLMACIPAIDVDTHQELCDNIGKNEETLNTGEPYEQ